MNKLIIDNKVYSLMIEQLLTKGCLCVIGGSKCGKSRMSIEIIKKLGGDVDKEIILDKIPGVAVAKKYKITELEKPIVFLKNVSGLNLIDLEHLLKSNFVIMTFPVANTGLLYNRFVSFDFNYGLIENYEERLWESIPVIIENKKLGDGNVYVEDAFLVNFKDNCINKNHFCQYQEDRNLFEEDYSRVNGKYRYF